MMSCSIVRRAGTVVFVGERVSLSLTPKPASPLPLQNPAGRSNRLIGWKAIGQLLGCTARTARRWEDSRGLPVHRINGGGRGSVWASREELQAWLQSMPVEAQADLRAEAEAEKADGPDEPPYEIPGDAVAQIPGDAVAQVPGDKVAQTLPASLIPAASNRRRNRWILGVAIVCVGLAVAAALQWKFWRMPTHSAVVPGSSPYDDDPEARKLYTNARLELSNRSPESLKAARKDFKELVDRLPERAAGWSGLADSYLLLREFGSMPDESAYPEADRAARVAIALDPQLADAWLDRAFIAFWWKGDTADAFSAFRTALQLDPQSAKAYHWYAAALLGQADFDRSLALFAQARALDPGNRALAADEAWALFVAGRRSEGIAALESLVEIDADFIGAHRWLARCYLNVGRDADFLREATLTAKLRAEENTLTRLSVAGERFRAGGRTAMLEQLSADAEADWRKGVGSAVAIAGYRALAQDRSGMMRWLRVADAAHDHLLRDVLTLPDFSAYRGDPEFASVIAHLRQ